MFSLRYENKMAAPIGKAGKFTNITKRLVNSAAVKKFGMDYESYFVINIYSSKYGQTNSIGGIMLHKQTVTARRRLAYASR